MKSNKDITILEAARLLGFTKNAVKYQAAKLPAEMTYKGEDGITYIKPVGITELRARMGNKNQQTTEQEPANNHTKTTKENSEETALFSALLKTVETLRGQLETKDKQIETLSNALQAAQQSATQAQALHAGTMQQALIEAKTTAENEPEEKKKKKGFLRWWNK